MINRYSIVIIMAILLFPATSLAQLIVDGESLKRRCDTVQLFMPSSGLGCRAYIGAMVDVFADGNSINGYRACVPSREKREAIVLSVRKWLDKHPELSGHKASTLVAQALSENYPCETP